MSSLRLISWNVNGARAVHKKGFLDWLEEASPDILCLQELKVTEDKVPAELFASRGYEIVIHAQKTWNGVLIASRTPITDVSCLSQIPQQLRSPVARTRLPQVQV